MKFLISLTSSFMCPLKINIIFLQLKSNFCHQKIVLFLIEKIIFVLLKFVLRYKSMSLLNFSGINRAFWHIFPAWTALAAIFHKMWFCSNPDWPNNPNSKTLVLIREICPLFRINWKPNSLLWFFFFGFWKSTHVKFNSDIHNYTIVVEQEEQKNGSK